MWIFTTSLLSTEYSSKLHESVDFPLCPNFLLPGISCCGNSPTHPVCRMTQQPNAARAAFSRMSVMQRLGGDLDPFESVRRRPVPIANATSVFAHA